MGNWKEMVEVDDITSLYHCSRVIIVLNWRKIVNMDMNYYRSMYNSNEYVLDSIKNLKFNYHVIVLTLMLLLICGGGE